MFDFFVCFREGNVVYFWCVWVLGLCCDGFFGGGEMWVDGGEGVCQKNKFFVWGDVVGCDVDEVVDEQGLIGFDGLLFWNNVLFYDERCVVFRVDEEFDVVF